MRLISSICLITVIASSVLAVENKTTEPNSLKSAVENFNQQAREHPLGKTQKLLTEEEVVAAIRGWLPETTPGVTTEVYETFQDIAESSTLPDGAELTFCPSWFHRGYSFQVWWIDLTVKTEANTVYTFRIRDQKLSSRKLSPGELNHLKKQDLPK